MDITYDKEANAMCQRCLGVTNVIAEREVKCAKTEPWCVLLFRSVGIISKIVIGVRGYCATCVSSNGDDNVPELLSLWSGSHTSDSARPSDHVRVRQHSTSDFSHFSDNSHRKVRLT